MRHSVYIQSIMPFFTNLTHWGRATHICVSNLTLIASDNGLSPVRRQAIIWNNAGILLIGPLAIDFSEILIEIQIFSFKKMYLKLSSANWRLLLLGLNELMAGYIIARSHKVAKPGIGPVRPPFLTGDNNATETPVKFHNNRTNVIQHLVASRKLLVRCILRLSE